MDLQIGNLFAVLAVFLASIAFIPYVIETWKIRGSKEVRPTVSGWFSWLLSDATIFAAMVANEAISWQMVPYVVGQIFVIGLSLRKGLKLAHMQGEVVSWRDAFMDWKQKDTVCVLLVVAAVVLWAIKHDPDYAIYLTTFSTAIGTLAVARPLTHDPYRESMLAWSGFLAGGIFGVAAIPVWSITGAWPPIMFVGVQGTMCILAARRFLPRYQRDLH